MSNTFTLAGARSAPAARGLLARCLFLTYGVLVYALFLCTFLYMMGFLFGVLVPKDVNAGEVGGVWTALLVNGACLGAFAVQHMIMARPAFKRAWTRIVPAAAERSTFVLAACLILITLVVSWRPLPGVLWHVEGPEAWLLYGLSAAGWCTVLYASFLIDHFELFGLRQSVSAFLGREARSPRFVERGIYRVARHPLMFGFMVAFWATPHMTWGHLFFAVMTTGYALVGTLIEERDLIAAHGESYRDYKRRVRAFLPIPRRAV
jgi:protein-S-isoprenylcysteine O-methyltransferase Ste14